MLYAEMMRQQFCPLCNLERATCETLENTSLFAEVNCPRCGRYRINAEAADVLPKTKLYLLSAVCRRWPDSAPPAITTEAIPKLLAKAPALGLGERLDLLLKLIADRTEQLGRWSEFDPHLDYPLLVLKNRDEVEFLTDALGKRGYLDVKTSAAKLTVKGWERLEEIKRTGRQSGLAFVAMWFDESVRALYDDGIEPAIRTAGYEPIRIDRHEHLNRIDDEIIGQMRRARFMVADFTGQRAGVYFEAGFMQGLGRNVIWMCKKEELTEHKIHFDVRQYRFIDWSDAEDARNRLLHSILANEGEGPFLT
jgi:hypothetical protein